MSLEPPWVYGLQSKPKPKVEVDAVAYVLEIFQEFCIEVAVIVYFPAYAEGDFPPVFGSVLAVICVAIEDACLATEIVVVARSHIVIEFVCPLSKGNAPAGDEVA